MFLVEIVGVFLGSYHSSNRHLLSVNLEGINESQPGQYGIVTHWYSIVAVIKDDLHISRHNSRSGPLLWENGERMNAWTLMDGGPHMQKLLSLLRAHVTKLITQHKLNG